MTSISRRTFVGSGLALGVAGAAPKYSLKLGWVTYQWGKDMDLPTLLATCEKAGIHGLELRTQHAHGVEPTLSKAQRAEARKRFADSPVKLIGYGSNCEFHSADPAAVKKNIEQAKEFILLMHDCGGLGVKVKPNGFIAGVPHEKTIEQIGKALNEVGAFGAAHGQKIRLEMHGRETNEAPNTKAILDVATNKNVYLCWNSNPTDLKGAGLDANFAMVKTRIGDTTHVRELDGGDYPYDQLFKLFAGNGYNGWILLEATRAVPDKVEALIAQRKVFEGLIVKLS